MTNDLQNIEAELYIILANYSDDLAALKKRDGKLPADAAVHAITQLCSSRETAARIEELEQFGDWALRHKRLSVSDVNIRIGDRQRELEATLKGAKPNEK